jgi:putative nucleotidyltransferase with HDIG domain
LRKSKNNQMKGYRIIVVDDEQGIIDTLKVLLGRVGYECVGTTDPVEAIGKALNDQFDLMILDYLMQPLHGDEVVEEIRKFNRELYILLLTGHKDLAPPMETIKRLEIQGYCEKSDRFDQLLLLVESGIKSIEQMRTIKKFQEGLNRILQAVPKIYQLQPISSILEEILLQIMPLVNSEDAFILVDDITRENDSNQSIYRGIGKYHTDVGDFIELLDPSMIESIGNARMSKKTVDIGKGVIFPLVNEFHKSMGVIYVEGRDIESGQKLLEIYAGQAASSINNAFLHSLVNIKNDELSRTYDQLRERYMDTIEALRMVVDAKDVYTRGHSDRVSYYAVKIGEMLGLSKEELEILRISGIFHDVGKISTANDILLKREALSAAEFEEIKKHPIKGAMILSAVSMFKEVVPVVKCHHERIDGMGYPEGLKGNEIPLLARIIAVADAFDAMMSDRTYRSKLNFSEAKNQLIQGAGTQFDAEIINIFLKVLNNYDEICKEIAATFV